MVPPAAAVWIPKGVRHAIASPQGARVRTVYLHASTTRRAPRSIVVLMLTRLAHSLIDHLATESMADDAATRRLVAVLLDQVRGLRALPVFVPTLATSLTRRVGEALAADPDGTARIHDLARALGVSGRTIERAFTADAAMSIGEWRRRARVCRALGLLSTGMAVKDVALEVGYENASAFVSAFKLSVGITPGRIGRRRL
jgi:transcriptional regulator GlxA family with amidase domain